MLAIGKYGWIQDWGLDILAIGFLALSIGLFIWKNKGTKWIISLTFLILIAVDLVLLAEHNQYAGRPGYTIHRKLVYTLASLFLLLNILIVPGLKDLKSYLKKFSYWIASLWFILAPLLPLIPDSLDGAYERLVSSLIVVWLSVVSFNLMKLNSDRRI